MDNATFGITLLVCGMGGTLLALAAMSLAMVLLGRLFPAKDDTSKTTNGSR